MSKKFLIALLVLGFSFSACAETAEPTAPASPARPTPSAQNQPSAETNSAQFTPAECPFDVPDAYTVDCGYLSVPENRLKADSPTIELAVAILRAPGDSPEPDPIIYLAGGPGGSALDDFIYEPQSWADYPFAQNRDLIFIDQRGTGHSRPSLNCYELDEEDYASAEANCHQRLVADGIDLSAYNTTQNAADIADLRRALNIESWNLLGISYGTRLALDVMRDHPEGIRSVVLDSPFPPNARTAEEEGLNTWQAIKSLFDDCAGDSQCAETFPDLETVFLETVAYLNQNPDADIYGDDVVYLMESALNGGEAYAYLLPLMIYQLADGDFEIFDDLYDELGGGGYTKFQGDGDDVSDSEGMFNSVSCHEEYSFSDPDSFDAEARSQIPLEVQEALLSVSYELFAVCDYWGAGSAAAIENEAVASDIPTLILVGQYDPATPPSWGELAARTLSRSFLFEFPGAGHSLLSSNNCAIELTDNFIANPASQPNTGCFDDLPGPIFALE